MKIAIFGSCVSRDTAETIWEAEVVAYVARHSVTSLESPHGSNGIDLSKLTSAFQQRMVANDLRGIGIDRIIQYGDDIDLILLDLVDERRGFWLFPDGTRVTNSLEIESCGATTEFRKAHARLVPFGSREHLAAWHKGFEFLIQRLKLAGLWERTVLVDVEWAVALEGARYPKFGILSKAGRSWRRIRRSVRNTYRSAQRGEGLVHAVENLYNYQPTQSENFLKIASKANYQYIEYRKIAKTLVAQVIERKRSEVRIDPRHRWGAQPFHYRRQDYISIGDEIVAIHRKRTGSDF